MVTSNGNWDLQAFRQHLPEEIISKIVSIPPPHPLASADRILWSHSRDGSSSVKSAYQMLKKSTWHQKATKWKQVWKYQGSYRIRFFIWLVYKKKLLTNQERVRRTIGQDPTCPVCHQATEDVLYVLKDCKEVEFIWKFFIPRVHWHSFFSRDLDEWLSVNLTSSGQIANSGTPWATLFRILIWRL